MSVREREREREREIVWFRHINAHFITRQHPHDAAESGNSLFAHVKTLAATVDDE